MKNRKILYTTILVVLGCFGLAPRAQALDSPAPDGDYPGHNTAEGEDALKSLHVPQNPPQDAPFNTAIGFKALHENTKGQNNTAVGANALFSNTTGLDNTAIGVEALHSGNGTANTGVGFQALRNNTALFNTALGFQALRNNTTGLSNTAVGVDALLNNIGSADSKDPFGGGFNTAVGGQALASNKVGVGNTATGYGALFTNVGAERDTGRGNTANGFVALYNSTGSGNIALGANAGFKLTTGDNNIYIGNPGVDAESNIIRIGTMGGSRTTSHAATYIAGIHGAVALLGAPVYVDNFGKLGTLPFTSSRHFKDGIKPMDKASEAIHALKPVTFRYKKELDPKGIPQFGLVAEDVEKVNPNLVVRDADGKPYTVRYEAVNAMLLNEFLKEHQKVQKLEAALKTVNERLKAQDAKIDKVNAKVEMSRPVPQTVVDNH